MLAHPLRAAVRRRQRQVLASPAGRAALLAVVQLLCALGAVLLGERNRAAPLWPCSAVAVFTLLLTARAQWRGIFAGNAAGILGGVLLGGAAPLNALWLTAIGQGEALACALLVHRAGMRRADLGRPRDLARFALVAALVPLASGLPAAGFLAAVRGAPFWGGFVNWALSHGPGLALVLPLLLIVQREARARPAVAGPATLACLMLVAGVAALVFRGAGQPGLFLLFPPVLLAAWQGGTLGAAGAVAVTAAFGLPLTVAGHGPLTSIEGLGAQLRLLQVFLLVLAATALPVAALLAAHRRLRRRQQRGVEALRRQAALLDSALAAMEQGLAAFDRNARLVAANAQYAALTGLPPAMVRRGAHYLDLARWLAERGHYGPGDPEALARQRLRATASGRLHRFTRSRPDGRCIEVTGRPLPGGGWVNTFTDITERTERERRLAESEASFRLLTEHSADVITRLRPDGAFAYVSPAARHVLGWPPEALCGRAMLDFVEAEDRAWVASAWAALAAGETGQTTVTFRFRRADESEAWVEAHGRLRRDLAGAPAEVVLALRDATDRKAAESELLAAFERMEAMAQTDGLTGLANRRRFDEMLAREWRRAAREGTFLALALALVDADRFKLYNDRYGHAAGDDCLRRLALAVASAARRAGDLAARYGGEEFVLLMPNTDLEGAIEVAERLRRDVLAQGAEHLGNPPLGVVSISLGVACVAPALHAAVDTDALLRAADHALYAAKEGGRNRVSAGSQAVDA